jgi:hypothetical protein
MGFGTYVTGRWDLPDDVITGTMDAVLRGQCSIEDVPFVLPAICRG